MKIFALKTKKFVFSISKLEKNHKLITYGGMLFLTISAYFLRLENKKVNIETVRLQERNFNVIKKMLIYNEKYENFPFPIFQKVKRGNEFIVQYINPTYIKWFGHNFEDDIARVVGKTNFDNFPKHIAQRFYELDITVAVTGEVLIKDEKQLDLDGKIIRTRVIKWREITNNNDTLVYGMVRDILNPHEINIRKD